MVEYLTTEGLKKIKEKLEYLKEIKKPEIIKRVAAAKELGDLTENTEYSTAKEEQGLVDAEIRRLENILRTAIIIKNEPQKNEVCPGNRVVVQIEKEKKEYWLVGSEEASPREGKISIDSPIGQSLLGKKIGEVATVKTPAGKKKIKVLKIF